MRSPVNRHSIWQVGVDALLVAGAWWLAWSLRFDQVRPVYYDRYLEWPIVLLVVAIKLPVFALCGFYNRWWRYVSTHDMWAALRGVVLASIAVFLVFTLFDVHRVAVPRGVWFIDLLVCMAFVAGSRLLARTIIERPLPGRIVSRGKEAVIVGAGDAGQLVVKEMQRTPGLGYTPIGLLDDDPRKRNLRLHGVRVLGTTADLAHVIRDRKPDEVLIAIPTASGELRARIFDTARALGVPVKTLPSLSELVSGDADLARQLRPIEVEDVLGREPVEVDFASIADYLQDEVVLVTGAGGSIGSELCRQIARIGPAKLVLLDHAEPALGTFGLLHILGLVSNVLSIPSFGFEGAPYLVDVFTGLTAAGFVLGALQYARRPIPRGLLAAFAIVLVTLLPGLRSSLPTPGLLTLVETVLIIVGLLIFTGRFTIIAQWLTPYLPTF